MRHPLLVHAVVPLLAGLCVVATLAASAPELVVNGKIIHTDPGIVVENGVSYGPLRATAEAVGGTVTWDAPNQQAII